MNQKPLVISIAAVSGGGKTTITDQLVNILHNVKALYFDDYEFEEYPKDVNEWIDNEADYNEWNLNPLIKDIQDLFNNRDQSLDYILLDYPFAYLNARMRGYIDLTHYLSRGRAAILKWKRQ